MRNGCAFHPLESAITVCSSCRRGLCSACWRRNVEKQPWCEQCVQHLASSGSPTALALVFLLLSVGTGAWLWRKDFDPFLQPPWFFWLLYAVGVCVISVYLVARQPRSPDLVIEERAEREQPAVQPGARVGRPYRVALRRASRLVASPLSGLWTSVSLLGCMLTAAVAVPWLLRLPKWIEAEAVIAIWWGLWCCILTVLLYRGWRLSDDHVLASSRVRGNRPPARAASEDGGPSWLDLGGGDELLIVLLLALVFGAAWLVVELAVPGLFFCAYLLVRTSLAHVANDRHGCEGQLGRALGWGVLWSTLVALPLAACVLLAHQWWRPPAGLYEPDRVTAPAAAPEP
jgi:hypothetical protein